MARIRKTLDQLKQERRDLDSKIRRREHAERELKERGAMEATKMLGLLDLAPAKAAKVGKKKAEEQTPGS